MSHEHLINLTIRMILLCRMAVHLIGFNQYQQTTFRHINDLGFRISSHKISKNSNIPSTANLHVSLLILISYRSRTTRTLPITHICSRLMVLHLLSFNFKFSPRSRTARSVARQCAAYDCVCVHRRLQFAENHQIQNSLKGNEKAEETSFPNNMSPGRKKATVSNRTAGPSEDGAVLPRKGELFHFSSHCLLSTVWPLNIHSTKVTLENHRKTKFQL